MDDTASSPQQQQQRAVTRRRRRRVAPEQRKRVATACNSCSVRRIKCSGDRPCTQCAQSSRSCQYPATLEKVSVSRAELSALQTRALDLERRLQESTSKSPSDAAVATIHSPTTPTPFRWRRTHAPPSDHVTGLHAATLADELSPSEGRLLQDPDGTARYFGESSGANFLNHVKEFMVTLQPLVGEPGSDTPSTSFLGSLGLYQTYDSRPLDVLNPVDPSWLPSRSEMMILLAEFRYFLQDGNGDFPSGGIFYWGDVPSTGPDHAHVTAGELPLLHMILAVAVRLDAASDWEGVRDTQRSSAAFYSRAQATLGNPLDITAYSDWHVSVLLVMALYLLEMNRRDAAWMTVSRAMHLAVMYGAHTTWSQDEGKKRVFWTLFLLDSWLSSWLGRPPLVPEGAIRLDLPQHAQGFPAPEGLTAHIQLARISRCVTCNVYRIAPADRSVMTTLKHVEDVLEMLQDWENSLPPELCLDYDSPTRDRANCILHIMFNQEIILATRPIFFVAVKKAVADRYLSVPVRQSIQDHPHANIISKIVDTAHSNLRLCRWVRDISPRKRLLHHESHAVFNAAVILLLYRLAFATNLEAAGHSETTDDTRMAIEVFEREAASGNNFGADCARVLQDLTYLAQRADEHTRLFMAASSTAIPAVGLESQPSSGPDPCINTGLEETSLPDMLSVMEQNSPLQRELQGWLDNDFLQMYNDFMY